MNTNTPVTQPPLPQSTTARAEMRGPRNTDIDNILSGLKKNESVENISISRNDDSLVSVTSLNDADKNILPKKSKKRNISDKKVVSLDI